MALVNVSALKCGAYLKVAVNRENTVPSGLDIKWAWKKEQDTVQNTKNPYYDLGYQAHKTPARRNTSMRANETNMHSSVHTNSATLMCVA